jgi:hypothetical protein
MTRRASNSQKRRTKPGASPAARHRHQRSDDGNAFIPDPEGGPAVIPDDLAESLAEDFLQAATSGEDVTEEAADEVVPEELGGPFIETSASEEFASGSDESNPPDAETEPLPLSGPGIIGIPKEELP